MGNLTSDFLKEVGQRMSQKSFWEAVPQEERSLMTSTLAFRSLSRGAGSVEMYLALARRQYPFKLFWVLTGQEEKIDEVHRDRACVRCRFALGHMRNITRGIC